MLKLFFLLTCLFLASNAGATTSPDTQNTVNMDQAKEEYRLFLKKLKELNSEYKQVTGEMAQVIKEEGVPTWDSGSLDATIQEIFPATPESVMDGVRFKETAGELIVTLDLPGIKRESINIKVREGVNLRVIAERKETQNLNKVDLAIKLPNPVKDTGGNASYEDGVLTIRFTKLLSQEISIPVR